MVGSYSKKRKVQDGMQGKTTRPKKFRKQREYHSSSEDEQDDQQGDFKPVNLADSDDEDEGGVTVTKKTVVAPPKKKTTKVVASAKSRPTADDSSDAADDDDEMQDDEFDEQDLVASASDDEDGEDDSDGDQSATGGKRRTIPKRNDPSAFSTSISKILSTKLPASARSDPVLSRSRKAAQTSSEWENEKLDKAARAKLRAEKKEELDRGRVRDVMGVERGLTGQVGEEEKRLRKTAQRGVVKLFNAVRAAQVRGEEAAREERKKGTVGMGEREKAVNEVSKQGFLELINGKKGKPLNIEEA
ncbi:hypothetical protein POX_a00446 [Penicillium oxalicum]|uniref:Ribosomal RNA-processing protein 15 n=1 Tax=Penicillium oxalicum (strain 114-2 / CGMCC 5302) TaxID=933388 RepID=S8A0E1_PENO1|nr:hypothetical protein POX_a00446 [Penicillium oxalicum]EPS34581.1 hypothetical protein PDE_09545 [Penicillium oxalicum 114-2]KAI2793859.1 hypothetical protein POX_a00446 [Penicillium oxalicum]